LFSLRKLLKTAIHSRNTISKKVLFEDKIVSCSGHIPVPGPPEKGAEFLASQILFAGNLEDPLFPNSQYCIVSLMAKNS
jgi:hypothetical protein